MVKIKAFTLGSKNRGGTCPPPPQFLHYSRPCLALQYVQVQCAVTLYLKSIDFKNLTQSL